MPGCVGGCEHFLRVCRSSLALLFTLVLFNEKRGKEATDRFLVPGLVVAFSILVLPLTHATRFNFYAGLPSLRASVESVASIFLFHDLNGLMVTRVSVMVGQWVIPAVLALAIAVTARRRPFRKLPPTDRVLLLTTGALAGSAALLVAGHRFFGILYPVRRTGIYWIPLLTLTCLTLAAKIPRSRWRIAALAPCVAAGLACILQFLAQWSVHHYAEWPDDFDTKRVVRKIIQDHPGHPPPPVTVGASWKMEPGLNFYRRRYRLHWMRPVERAESVPAGDYYVLQGADRARLRSWG